MRLVALAAALLWALPTSGATPRSKPTHPANAYDRAIAIHSEQARLNPRLVKALIYVESDFDTHAVSPAGALGLMQLMPATSEQIGVPRHRLREPDANIRAGTKFLNSLFKEARRKHKFKARRMDEAPLWVQRRVLAAYNAGPRMLARDKWPRQTRIYVDRILKASRENKSKLRT